MTPSSALCLRLALLGATALSAPCFVPMAAAQPAPGARPTGGVVVGGAASIGRSATSTTITQSSPNAAINWQGFDVGRDQSVTFQQPSSTAVTLNRVTGPDPSAIAGRVSANGKIVLINPSGVVFSDGAQVNAQSVVVSVAGMSTEAFMAGSTTFDRPGRPGARIVNRGTITAGQAGLVGLVAPSVANDGVISAKLGHVVLGGAETHTLDFYGDGLLSVDVGGQVRTAAKGADGKPVTALVTNTGTIIAEGGTVRLTAAAADGVVTHLVDAGGRISAHDVSFDGTGGSIVLEGRVKADGFGPAGTGGTISATASDTVTVASGAHLSANGAAGGGTVAIGRAGGRVSRAAVVQSGARISASARVAGNGGTVSVIGTDRASHAGTIVARGGPSGGAGGQVEISGAMISLGGSVDVAAPRGAPGSILIDPRDLTVSDAAGGVTPGSGDPAIAYNDGGTITDSTVTPAALEALTGGTVHLQAYRDLTVLNSVSLAQGQSLFLEAGRNLTVASGATLSAPASVTLTAAATFVDPSTELSIQPFPGGSISLMGDVVLTSGQLSLNAGTGGMVLGGAITAQSVYLTTTGDVTQPSGSITTTLFGVSGSVGSLSLPQPNNLGGGVNVSASSGDILIALAPGLTLGTPQLSVSSGHSITMVADYVAFAGEQGPVAAPNGTVTFAPATRGFPIAVTPTGSPQTGTLTLSSNALDNLVQAATLQLGLHDAGGATAGPITIGGNATDVVDLSSIGATYDSDGFFVGNAPVTLIVHSGGSVSQLGTLIVTNLAGDALSLDLPTTTNQIETLAGFTTTNGLTLASSGGLTVTGPVTSTQGDVSLTATSLGIMSMPGAGGTLEIDAAVFGANVALFGEQGVKTVGAGVTATRLSGGVSGVSESGDGLDFSVAVPNANTINSLGDISVTGNISITSISPIEIAGRLTTTAAGGTSNFYIQSNAAISIDASGVIDLSAATGGNALTLSAGGALSEAQGATVNTAALDAVGTDIALPSTLNQIASVTSVSATSGDITIVDAAPLYIDGLVATVASGRTITLSTDQLSFASAFQAGGNGRIIAQGGTVYLAPFTPNSELDFVNGVNGQPNAAVIALPLLIPITADTLQLGNASTGPIRVGNTGDSLLLTSVGTLSLVSSGTVTEPGNLFVPVLAGTAEAAAINGTNTILALGSFTTTGDFSMRDVPVLGVNGPVTAGGTVSIQSTGGLQIGGNISAASGTLNTSGALGQNFGTITVPGLLRLSAQNAVSQGTNAVLSLGTLSVNGSSTSLPNIGNSFAVLAAVQGGGNVSLGDSTGFVLTGPLNGQAATIVSNGDVTQSSSGAIAIASLSGRAQSLDWIQTNNLIITLGSFSTTGSLSLAIAQALTVAGPVTAGSALSLASRGPLTLTGNLTAPTISLTATNGELAGSIVQSGGSISTGTLTGASSGVALLTSSTNQVATLAAFSSVGGFTLETAGNLAVLGPVVDTTSSAFASGGALTLSGNVTAPNVVLSAQGAVSQTGGSITATGALAASGASVSLGSSTNQIATLGSLTASSGGGLLADASPLSITGPATVASGQTLTLQVTQPTLAAGGALVAPNGTVVIRPLADGQALAIGSDGLTGTPAVTAATLVFGSPATSALSISGDLSLDNVGTLSLQSAGAVTDTSVIRVAALTGQSGSASLTGQNAIGTLQGFAVGTNFALTDASALAIAGQVTAPGTASFAISGALSETGAGAISAGTLIVTGGPVTLTGANTIQTIAAVTSPSAVTITDSGPVTVSAITAVGNVALNGGANGGSLVIAGTITTPGTVSLSSFAAIAESGAGAIKAGALSGVSASGQIALGGANTAASIANVSSGGSLVLAVNGSTSISGISSGTDLTLSTTGGLTVAGQVTAPGTGNLTVTGALAESGAGSLSLGTLTGSAASVVLTGANTIAALGAFKSTGGLSLSDNESLLVGQVSAGSAVTLAVTGGDLTIAGVVSTPTVVNLGATGRIGEQSTGTLTAAALSSAVGASVTLGSANQLASLNSVSGANGVAITTAGPTTVGTVTSGADITLTLPGVSVVQGTISTPGAVTLVTPGVTELGGINAGRLTFVGAPAGSATLTGTNTVGTLGASSGLSVTLTNQGALTVLSGGSLDALSITASGTVTLGSGATTVRAVSVTAPSVVQTGTTTFDPLTGAFGAQGTLVLNVAGSGQGGTVQLANLLAPNDAVTLRLGQGGTATGTLSAGSLLIAGSGGSANLFGSVGGQTGFAAAIAARIQPSFDTQYLLNNCAIASVTCTPPQITTTSSTLQILPSTLFQPDSTLRPDLINLELLTLAVARDPSDPDLLLPNVAARDY